MGVDESDTDGEIHGSVDLQGAHDSSQPSASPAARGSRLTPVGLWLGVELVGAVGIEPNRFGLKGREKSFPLRTP